MLDRLLSKIVVPQGAENRMRWRGEAGRYEVWYLTLNVPGERAAFWLRYTLDAPLPGTGEPRCELWGHAFFGGEPARSFGLKATHPIADLRREGCLIGIGPWRYEEGTLAGELANGAHRMAWRLSYAPSPTSVHLAPWLVRASHLPKTEVRFPNVAARFGGTVEVDGRVFAVSGAPGHQGHLYGKKHVERWSWLHCSAFDGAEDASIDGVAAFLRDGQKAPLTGLFLRIGRQEIPLNTMLGMARTRGSVSFPRWSFSSRAPEVSLEGEATLAPDRALQVIYEDPDGQKSFCANSCLADLSLSLRWRDGRRQELRATGTANLEFGARVPFPAVRAVSPSRELR